MLEESIEAWQEERAAAHEGEEGGLREVRVHLNLVHGWRDCTALITAQPGRHIMLYTFARLEQVHHERASEV